MKEETMYRKWNENKKMIIQNNSMIGDLINDVNQLQQLVSGFLGVIRKLPGYDKAIKELAKEHEIAEKKAKKKALAEAKKNCNDDCKGCISCKPEPKILNMDPIKHPKAKTDSPVILEMSRRKND